MIVKLSGFLDFINDDSIHIEVNGVVYKVFISTKDFKNISQVGEVIEINIHEILREDARYLFGFLSLDEKLIFEDLIKVQGVGGKMALNVIGSLDVSEIVQSVRENNTLNFTKISGIGNKVSQRLINELRDKIEKGLYNRENNKLDPKIGDSIFNDLYSCLVNLGYQLKVCEEVSRRVLNENSDTGLEKLIPIALKVIKTYQRKV
ncbi:Holliday junction branch migration protein RuvA [Rickettsiales bacterium]|nr:Holliday junction branch migration protein RuvA [Rickettsiales bacterium]